MTSKNMGDIRHQSLGYATPSEVYSGEVEIEGFEVKTGGRSC